VDYEERVSGGTLGAFFRGRTVPQLKAKTGHVVSTIGNSSDILRYVYGRYVATDPQGAAFLEPTAERVALEQRLDRYGDAFPSSYREDFNLSVSMNTVGCAARKFTISTTH